MSSRRVILGLINTFSLSFFCSISSPYKCVLHAVLGGFCLNQSSRCLLGETVTHGCALSDYSLETLRLLCLLIQRRERVHIHTNTCTHVHKCTKQQVATHQLDKSKPAKSTAAHWTNAGPREKWRRISRVQKFFFVVFVSLSSQLWHFYIWHSCQCDSGIRHTANSLGQTKHMVDALHERGVN